MIEKYIKEITELAGLEFYRFKRYGIPFCLILVEIEDELFHEVIERAIRKTDHYRQMDDNFYAIVYSHSDMDAAKNAFFHVFNELGGRSNISKLAITEVKPSDRTEEDLIRRVYDELVELKSL